MRAELEGGIILDYLDLILKADQHSPATPIAMLS
jgi:hypothetical protein